MTYISALCIENITLLVPKRQLATATRDKLFTMSGNSTLLVPKRQLATATRDKLFTMSGR
jgi:hypothetical protein